MKELEQFYKDNDIEYSADGIGNEVWTYKGITIANYIDMPNEVTHVYCHWAIDKHSAWSCERGKIKPVLKVNKIYYWPANDSKRFKPCFFKQKPWADFENPYKDIEGFKEKLLTSVNLLKGRLQVLKGKRTMFNKHKYKSYSNADCLDKCMSFINWNRIFGNGRTDAHIKLANGNVLPCHKLENGLIYVIDSDNVYMCHTTIKYKREWPNNITIPKADFIKIAEKEFFME